ncbi:helix-turn-helix transcriptional regulator [Micromonospora sp. M12]
MKVIVMRPSCAAAQVGARDVATVGQAIPPSSCWGAKQSRRDDAGCGAGATIRAWRDRLSPASTGLPAGHGRRAAGLRREELAELAGVSVDYIVRLEQGRATTRRRR